MVWGLDLGFVGFMASDLGLGFVALGFWGLKASRGRRVCLWGFVFSAFLVNRVSCITVGNTLNCNH